MTEKLERLECPVCHKKVALRAGKFVYHKWLLPHGGRFVPCSGIGRTVKRVETSEPATHAEVR